MRRAAAAAAAAAAAGGDLDGIVVLGSGVLLCGRGDETTRAGWAQKLLK